MNVVVLYQSMRGGTRRTAELVGEAAVRAGCTTSVFPVTNFDYKALATADVVFLGTWTDGLLGIGARPGQMGKLRSLPELAGKRVGLFLSYQISPKAALDKFARWAENRGAQVVAARGFARKAPGAGTDDFVSEALSAVSVS